MTEPSTETLVRAQEVYRNLSEYNQFEWENVDIIARAIMEAEERGAAREREECAKVVTDGYQGLSQEHRILLLARATAIRARGK